MKPTYNSLTTTKCENIYTPSFWQRLSSARLQLCMLVSRMTRSLLSSKTAALRGVETILVNSSNTLKVNLRLNLAIAFMLVIAPLVNVSYRVFDHTQVVDGWYYTNYHDLFYVLCPWLALILFSTGIFLLFPQGSKRAWLLVLPVMAAVSKCLWLIQITSNEEFHQTVPIYFLLPALSIAFIWIFLIDWLMARK